MELDSDILNIIPDKSKATRRGRSVYKERGGSQATAEVSEEVQKQKEVSERESKSLGQDNGNPF